jgi:hypothetical protein
LLILKGFIRLCAARERERERERERDRERDSIIITVLGTDHQHSNHLIYSMTNLAHEQIAVKALTFHNKHNLHC